MRLGCLQVTRRLSKLLGSQDDNQAGTQNPNDWAETLHKVTALRGRTDPRVAQTTQETGFSHLLYC